MKQHRKTHIHPNYWLFPTKQNHFHPVSLRPLGLIVVAIVMALIPLVYNVTATGKPQVLGYATNITIAGLNSASNQQRANAGIASLALNSALSQAAYNKALDMFADNYWAHTAPDGTQPWTFIQQAGYSYSTAGENLAKNFSTSDGVVNGWMNSAAHKANILSTSYVDVGYAVMNGTLLGEETTLVVAMYAAPKATSVPAPSVAPATNTSTPPASTPTAPSSKTPEANTLAPSQETPVPQETIAPAPQPAQASKPTEQKQGVLASAEVSNEAVKGASIVSLPVETYRSFNWGQKASLFILTVILLLFIMKHTVIWRASKRGARHIWLRAHPLAQGAVLVVAIILTITAGTGSIL